MKKYFIAKQSVSTVPRVPDFPTRSSDINTVLDIVGKAHLVDLLAATTRPETTSCH